MYILLSLAIFLVSLVAVEKYPVLIVKILLSITILPRVIFQMTPYWNEDYALLTHGIYIYDIILLAMCIAVGKYSVSNLHALKNLNSQLFFSSCLLALWFLFEILRNFVTHFLSSFGEFRYTYLILIFPLYICFVLDTKEKRLKIFKFLIVLSTLAVFLSIPIVGVLKGWEIGGADNRFFSAVVSLGLVYSLLAIYYSKKYGLLKINSLYINIIAFLAIVIILIDSHRSVWLVGIVLLVLLVMNNEIKIKLNQIFIVPFIGILLLIVLSMLNINPIQYIIERGQAFVNPGDDTSANYRLVLWAYYFGNFLENPLIGKGFGGWWNFYFEPFDEYVTTAPHNYYLQALVKIGLIGLFLYAYVVYKLYYSLKNKKYSAIFTKDPELTYIKIALLMLISSHIFYIFYSHEYFTLSYIGLASAYAFHKKDVLSTYKFKLLNKGY